ncbi:hypothetical protein B5X24_HaOG208201 [Helicoverpa armigera]|uniref:Uncharacterized protein n=1 Tax=Helicoverpa armigera TaxID=29058 RepID=A0A2W1BIU3_HELAM|nr:hypothetical protein B5X24_HaOG208201 [Helicoverpa armigera]
MSQPGKGRKPGRLIYSEASERAPGRATAAVAAAGGVTSRAINGTDVEAPPAPPARAHPGSPAASLPACLGWNTTRIYCTVN